MEEISQEIKAILDMGHKRIALEAGEDAVNCPIEYITEAMRQIYATTSGNASIRRINVNIAATTVDEYKMLKDAGIGTYVLFQETYHRETYKNMHSGPKADYDGIQLPWTGHLLQASTMWAWGCCTGFTIGGSRP